MNPIHYDLWGRCTNFVTRTCGTRDASHGLAHVRKVTEQAVLLYLMSTTAKTTAAEQAGMLYRIILVGMLHDVADHKYDTDGTLFDQVDAFLEAEAGTLHSLITDTSSEVFYAPLPCSTAAVDAVLPVKQLLLTALSAISYSKENRLGMRWFVPELSCGPEDAADKAGGRAATCSWIAVRDFVSDADKLEAIGEEGLLRCYEYTCARYREAALAGKKEAEAQAETTSRDAACAARIERHVESIMLHDVVEHFHEKLERLLPRYIVTTAGKYLGAPRDAEMAALLSQWEVHGPPPVTVYWRDVASEYTMPE